MDTPVVLVSGHPTLLSLPLPALGESFLVDVSTSLPVGALPVGLRAFGDKLEVGLGHDTDRSESDLESGSDYSSDSDSDSSLDQLDQFMPPPPRQALPIARKRHPTIQIASIRYRNSTLSNDDRGARTPSPSPVAPLSPPQSPTTTELPYLSMDRPQSTALSSSPSIEPSTPSPPSPPLVKFRLPSSIPSPPLSPPRLFVTPPSPGFRRSSSSVALSVRKATPSPPPVPTRSTANKPLRGSRSTGDLLGKTDRRPLPRRPTLPAPLRAAPKSLPPPLTLVQQEVSYSIERLLSPSVFEAFIADPSGHRRFYEYLEVTPRGCEPIGLRCDLQLLQQICEEANLGALTERIRAEGRRQALVEGGALTTSLQSFDANDPQQHLLTSTYASDFDGFLKYSLVEHQRVELGKYNVNPSDHSLLGEAFILTNPRLRDAPIVLVSAEFCAMTGYSRLQIVGRNCRFLQGEATSPSSINTIRTAIEEEVGVTQLILTYRVDGTAFWNFLCILPLRDVRGDVIYWVGGQTDVSTQMSVGSNLSALFQGGTTTASSSRKLSRSKSSKDFQTMPTQFSHPDSPPQTPGSISGSTKSAGRFGRLFRKSSKVSRGVEVQDTPSPVPAKLEIRIADFTASHEKVLMFRKEGREVLYVTAAFLRCCGLPGSKPQDVCTSPLIHMDILDIVESEAGPAGKDALDARLLDSIRDGTSLAVRCGIRLRKRTLFGRSSDARPPVFGTLQLTPLEDSFGVVISFIALFA